MGVLIIIGVCHILEYKPNDIIMMSFIGDAEYVVYARSHAQSGIATLPQVPHHIIRHHTYRRTHITGNNLIPIFIPIRYKLLN